MTEINCSIERVVFRNEDNGFTVVDIKYDKHQTRAVGIMPEVRVGMSYVMFGKFEQNGKFGEQFSVKDCRETQPNDEASLLTFLSSGIIKGIGPKTAAVIVDKYGKDSLNIIENTPEKLLEINGIGKKKLDEIVSSYFEHKEIAEVILYFTKLGVERSAAMKLYKRYGNETIPIITEDPYRMIRDVDGIDFKHADRIALKLSENGSENDEERIKSGIIYVLSRSVQDGNTYLPKEKLLDSTSMLLGQTVMREEIEDAAFALVIEGLVESSKIHEEECYFLDSMYRAEKNICNDLIRLKNADIKAINIDAGNLVQATEKEKGIAFSEEQKKAIMSSLENGVFVITGGPGTGKTTIIRVVADIFSFCDFDVAIAAPTGRAAKRITESTGYDAKTIHRLLEYSSDPDGDKMFFGRDASYPLEIDVLIVDEASMIDVFLMQALVDALPSGARLIIVGDADQLPSVSAGNVLKDMLASEVIDYEQLTEIYRQAKESLIVTNAHEINHGRMPLVNKEDGNFFLYKKADEISALSTIVSLCQKRLPAYCIETNIKPDIQVITPVKQGRLGSINLNAELQSVLNPKDPLKNEWKIGGKVFREGDKIMQMCNDYEIEWMDIDGFTEGKGIFNGDVGIVECINEYDKNLYVIYDENKRVKYDDANIENIELAFAITVHKSQGSEYPVVVMPMMFVPPVLATRNLLYTAVTRGKSLVVLVGSENRLQVMVASAGSKDRYSALDYFLSTQLQNVPF